MANYLGVSLNLFNWEQIRSVSNWVIIRKKGTVKTLTISHPGFSESSHQLWTILNRQNLQLALCCLSLMFLQNFQLIFDPKKKKFQYYISHKSHIRVHLIFHTHLNQRSRRRRSWRRGWRWTSSLFEINNVPMIQLCMCQSFRFTGSQLKLKLHKNLNPQKLKTLTSPVKFLSLYKENPKSSKISVLWTAS